MGEWTATPLEMEFRFGEFRLLRVNLRGLSLPGQRAAAGDGGPLPPADAFAGQTDAALVRSLPIEQPLPRVSLTGGLIRYVPSQYRRYFVDLKEGTFEQYLQGFSSKSRNTLKRKIRKCAEVHGGDMVL